MKTFLFLFLGLTITTVGFGQFHPSRADLNDDGKVDIADLAEFAGAWLWESTCQTAIPVEFNTHTVRTAETSYWYVFTPEYTMYYSISLCVGSDGYTASIYDDCAQAPIADTSEGCRVDVQMVAGQSYYIRVEKTSPATGDFDLYISFAE